MKNQDEILELLKGMNETLGRMTGRLDAIEEHLSGCEEHLS